MLKQIQKIKNLGVFDDYTKPIGMADFAEKNIIYGWNYSGKTTLSRLFGMLAKRQINNDFPRCKFSVQDGAGIAITENELATSTKNIAVFNPDFVEANLSWQGAAFEPILLLGDDSIEAEKRIVALEEVVSRCRTGYSLKKKAIEAANLKLAEAKTATAKQIKTTLRLVEAFTAAHLSQELSLISLFDPTSVPPLTAEEAATDLKLALTVEEERLPVVPKVVLSTRLEDLIVQANRLLVSVPVFTSTLKHLEDNVEIANWIQTGLNIHEGRTDCEFCGNTIGADRLAALRGHFSRDVLNHKNSLKQLASTVKGTTLAEIDIRPSQLNLQFREKLPGLLEALNVQIRTYNETVEAIVTALGKKSDSPFSAGSPFSDRKIENAALSSALADLNSLLEENNKSANSFSSQKKIAISRLKRHFSFEFYKNFNLSGHTLVLDRWAKHLHRYERFANSIKDDLKALNATINKAQKGREKINERIANLLGGDRLEITVIDAGGEDRFQLTRAGLIAKNLSEGEKTAVAFAFFLTKLEEWNDIGQVIVYIDDPISSLDSNHIFQVYSIIKTLFFKQVQGQGSLEWTTACKQLFISTHNFEFFSLLKELPGSKNKSRYYLTKRVSATTAALVDMPKSILKYSSEYHYLFSVMHRFYNAADKTDIEILLSLPNAVRRFLELYTYSKLPLADSTVDQRAEMLFGAEKALRILKVLHHFSHIGNIDRLAMNTNLVADVETVIAEVMEHLKADPSHFAALEKSIDVA